MAKHVSTIDKIELTFDLHNFQGEGLGTPKTNYGPRKMILRKNGYDF